MLANDHGVFEVDLAVPAVPPGTWEATAVGEMAGATDAALGQFVIGVPDDDDATVPVPGSYPMTMGTTIPVSSQLAPHLCG